MQDVAHNRRASCLREGPRVCPVTPFTWSPGADKATSRVLLGSKRHAAGLVARILNSKPFYSILILPRVTA